MDHADSEARARVVQVTEFFLHARVARALEGYVFGPAVAVELAGARETQSEGFTTCLTQTFLRFPHTSPVS